MVLIITPLAAKQLKAMPKTDAKRLLAALELVAADIHFRHPFVTELVGKPGMWRLRKGDWRAVYKVIDGDVVVMVTGNRRDVYDERN